MLFERWKKKFVSNDALLIISAYCTHIGVDKNRSQSRHLCSKKRFLKPTRKCHEAICSLSKNSPLARPTTTSSNIISPISSNFSGIQHFIHWIESISLFNPSHFAELENFSSAGKQEKYRSNAHIYAVIHALKSMFI